MTESAQAERQDSLMQAYHLLIQWGRERLAKHADDETDSTEETTEPSDELVA